LRNWSAELRTESEEDYTYRQKNSAFDLWPSSLYLRRARLRFTDGTRIK
jgi:hypothetical protein